jgi:predicted XRE-type DNA-binding protein
MNQYRDADEPEQVLSLASVRKGISMSQVTLASNGGMSQPWVSNIENKPIDKVTIGALENYVEALGGELVIYVDLAGSRYRIR